MNEGHREQNPAGALQEGSNEYRQEPKHKVEMISFWVWPLFWFVCLLWSEILIRFSVQAPWGLGLLYIVFFAGAAALLLSLFLALARERLRRVLAFVFLVVLFFVYLSQFTYYRFFSTYYSFFSLVRGGQVTEFAEDVGKEFLRSFPYVLLFGLPLLLYILVLHKKLPQSKTSWKLRVVLALSMVAMQLLAIGFLQVQKDQVNSAYSLYYRKIQPNEAVNQLGLLTSMRLDFARTFLGRELLEELPGPSVPSQLTVIPSSSVTSSSDSQTIPTVPRETTITTAPTSAAASTPTPIPTPAPNILPIDFVDLLDRESDSGILQLHSYFAEQPPTQKNAHTGQFEGYNLILVTAEAFSHYAVDPDLTPTLYKMQQEGFQFQNFYNPVWGVSTLDGEYVALTGLLPKAGVWSMLRSANNSLPFTMGRQFQALGVDTKAYHNHTYTYYQRDQSHPNLGYDYKGIGNGLDVRKTWPESDLEMMQKTVDEYINQERFHTYYLTISGHMNYSYNGNFIASKNRDLVKHLPYAEPAQAYLACQIEFDRAMEYLLLRLEEAGVAEKTLLVISADHYPYGLEKRDLDELAGHEVEENFELYRSSLLIYAKGMTPEVVEKPVSSLDILPTISNLLDLPFDSRLLSGTDIFSDSAPLVIFNNRSFITDIGRYNARTKEFTLTPGASAPEDYAAQVSQMIEYKFTAAARILDKDYYRRVLPPS